MLLVNMDNVPRRELNKLQISEILHDIMRMEKSSNPDKYARCTPKYGRYVSWYARAIDNGEIEISDKNIVATVDFLEKMSGAVPCNVEHVDSAVSKLKIQYANAIISGRVNVPKKDLKYIIDGFESELRRNNDDNNVITSALEKIRPLYQEMCEEDKDEFVQNPSKVFFERQKAKKQLKSLRLKEGIKKKFAKKIVKTGIEVKFGSETKVFYKSDINKFISEIKRLDNSNLEYCEQVAFNLFVLKDNENLSEKQKYRIANALNAFYKKYEQLKEKTENKSNVHVLEKIKVKVADVAQSCEQKIAEKIEQYKNVAQRKAQKPLFARAIPYAASVLLLVGTTFGFSQHSMHAGETDAPKKDNKIKVAQQNTKNNDGKTYMVSEQDLARAHGSFAVQQSEPIVKDTVVKHDQKVAPKTVVKNNEKSNAMDKFYDSRLDKLGGAKKDEVLQKIQNRMENVDLGGVSAKRVAYTYFIYSAYGYNIDVLNNFVNGVELNSNDIKELKNVIDMAKPHGTGVRDMAAAHITSREIHEMCAGGGKVNAAKKTVRAKSGVKTQISNKKITQQDMLRMHKNIIDSGKYSLTSEQHQKLSWLLLGEHKDCLNPDEAAELTKLLLLAGFDKDIVSQYVCQRIYSEPVLMPDNYVQRVETQNGQKKPVWYTRCFRISRYSR